MRDGRENIDDFDDGRTIADMSDVRRSPLLVPRGEDVARLRNNHTGTHGPTAAPQMPRRDITEEIGSPEERFMLILGALKAGLAIGLVYVIAFGIFIAILLAIWM